MTIVAFLQNLRQIVLRVAAYVSVILVAITGLLIYVWTDRLDLPDSNLPIAPDLPREPDSVTVTWLGVSTLLFDDSETQILIDGFFSRPSLADVVFGRRVESNAAEINEILNDYRMRRIAVIVPSHTHFDHAMDISAIAQRTNAVIFGSESAAQIARGGGVPEEQILVAESKSSEEFGNFTVTLIESVHSPFGWRGSVPLDGDIEAPLEMPASIEEWRVGTSYSIVVAHPQGTTLIQTSSGFSDNALDDVAADVVMMGTAMLDSLGKAYAERYWLSLVTATGASTVYPVHFDDYTQPWGQIELAPRLIDNFIETASWLQEFRDSWDTDVDIYLPEFGRPLVLYPVAEPET